MVSLLSFARSPRTLILACSALAVAALLAYWARGEKGPHSSSFGDEALPFAARTRELSRRIARNPRDAEAHFQLGLLHEENGHYSAALESFHLSESAGRRERDIAAAQGRCFAKLDRLEEAEAAFRQAAADGSGGVQAVTDLTTVLARQDKKADARALLHRAALTLGAGPISAGRASDAAALARAYDFLGDRESALDWAESAARAAPSVADNYLIAGRMFLALGRFAEASDRLGRAVQLLPGSAAARELHGDALAKLDPRGEAALDRWMEAIELRSTRPATYFRSADAIGKRGELERAAEIYMRAGIRTAERPAAFRRAADLWERAGNREQAMYCRATAAASGGEFGRALAEYRKLGSSDDPGWKRKGLEGAAEMLRLLNRPQEYLRAARQLSEAGGAGDHLRLANAYLLTGEPALREAHLRKALALDPSTAGVALAELGMAAEKERRLDEAVSLYRKAAESAPADAEVKLMLSRLLIKRGRSEDRQPAVKAAAEAAATAPSHAGALLQLGRAATAQGNHNLAKQAFQHAIDLSPADPMPYELLAGEYRALGRFEEAEDARRAARRWRRSSGPGAAAPRRGP